MVAAAAAVEAVLVVRQQRRTCHGADAMAGGRGGGKSFPFPKRGEISSDEK